MMVAPQEGGCYKGQGQGVPGANPFRPSPPEPLFDIEAGTISAAVKRYTEAQEEETVSVKEALEGLPQMSDNIKAFDDAMDTVYKSMRDIMISKQKLRGSGNIDNQGLMGVVTRMKEDKLERVMKSVKRDVFRDQLLADGVPSEVVDQYYPARDVAEAHAEDTLEDDLLDVANYAIICVMVLRGIWGLPVAAE